MSTKRIKKRLDHRMQEQYPAWSKNKIQAMIMQGKVQVDKRVLTKAGTLVSVDAHIIVQEPENTFASRAGYKLDAALEAFGFCVQGLSVLDAGISTGGFADCLLRRGARIIYGIDVGYGLLHESLVKDPRVVLFERTNLRYVESLPELVDLATLDLSFISLTKVHAVVYRLVKPGGHVLALIKPQFEAGRRAVPRGGVIVDSQVHATVLETVHSAFAAQGFQVLRTMPSPVLGSAGNQEFISLFLKI